MFKYLHGFCFRMCWFQNKNFDSFYNLDSFFLYSIDLNNVGRRVFFNKEKIIYFTIKREDMKNRKLNLQKQTD